MSLEGEFEEIGFEPANGGAGVVEGDAIVVIIVEWHVGMAIIDIGDAGKKMMVLEIGDDLGCLGLLDLEQRDAAM